MNNFGTKRNYTIDLMRLFFAVQIVALHTSPLVEYSPLASYAFSQSISRLAVPFFAAVSGYYFFLKEPRPYRKTIIKLTYLYVFWSLAAFIYTAIIWKKSFTEFIAYVLRLFFFEGWQHLWYILAVIFLIALIFVLGKIGVNEKKLFWISWPFYALGAARYNYGMLCQRNVFLKKIFAVIDSIPQKNWLLLIFPFFMMGVLLNSVNDERLVKKSGWLCILSLLGFCIEAIMTTVLGWKENLIVCIFTYPTVFFLLLWCINNPEKGYFRFFEYINPSKTASCIYASHYIILTVLFKLGISETLTFILTLLSSLLLEIVITRINNPTLNRII